jgi:hypothetical protein
MPVIQKENAPEVPAQLIAQAIVKIGDAAQAMSRSGLTLKAQLILLSALSGETRKTCQQVLWALQNLKKEYLVSPPGKGSAK